MVTLIGREEFDPALIKPNRNLPVYVDHQHSPLARLKHRPAWYIGLHTYQRT